ncbi:B12-binding domain-containing radical SAM protein [Actinocorallia sp. A-T 12471]|uniref:B12-binding domain-containing radical SAM protein n=1 Tax=Actinocorallia sp. A-T 12471 TaxID=3089813 RepID=UPI0029CD9187|nr:radical SAM protein [Actinocorallia sp. A-T 12471]MDX6743810.1 radical SAM protein [Actinocorallia sp. A-T 12471]
MGTGRALFLSPALNEAGYQSAESLGLRSVAAVLRARSVEVRVVEECPVPLPAEVEEFASGCRVIGLGALFTRQIPEVMELARRVRSVAPNAHLVIGGQGLEFLWERVLTDCPALDSACMHEGDETIGELWDRVVTGATAAGVPGLYARDRHAIAPGKVRPPVADLDVLPFPWREPDPLRYPDGHVTMATSRGCAAHCTFCQSGNYGNRYHRLPRWRARSAESAVAEISSLVAAHGVKAISFVDDDFLGGDARGRDRALRFAELLAAQSYEVKFSIECRINELDAELLAVLRSVGLRHLLIGVESANEPDLALFAKKTTPEQAEEAIALLRRLGIDFSMGFIMFQPMSDTEGIRTNLEFLKRNKVGSHRRVSNRLEVYPGSPLYSYFKRRGVTFKEERYRLYYEFSDPVITKLYDIYKEILRPFAEIEESCLRSLFQEDTKGSGSDSAVIQSLMSLKDDISSTLVATAIEALEAVTHHKEPATDSPLSLKVSERVSDLNRRLSAVKGGTHVDHG